MKQRSCTWEQLLQKQTMHEESIIKASDQSFVRKVNVPLVEI